VPRPIAATRPSECAQRMGERRSDGRMARSAEERRRGNVELKRSREWAVPGSNGRPPACKAGGVGDVVASEAREIALELGARGAAMRLRRGVSGSV
jgi:hypothetical protein